MMMVAPTREGRRHLLLSLTPDWQPHQRRAGRPAIRFQASRVGGGLFVGFSDDRRLFFLVLILSVFFVFVIIVVGVPRRQHVVHDGDETPSWPTRRKRSRGCVGSAR